MRIFNSDVDMGATPSELCDVVTGPFLPRHGYNMKRFLDVALACNLVTKSQIADLPWFPYGSGTTDALEYLFGTSSKLLQSNKALTRLRLMDLDDWLEKHWHSVGRRLRLPPHGLPDLSTQLCQWKRAAFGVEVQDVRDIFFQTQ